MSDNALENSLRAISERNQRTRASLVKLTARVTELTLSGTMDELHDFNNELAAEMDRLLEPQGKDSAAGGADSGTGHESESSGEPAQ